ncbi:hypothetical protein DXG03_006491 [Asterophora parasitica]|uniref:Uncharacterized protein n=1 Tax=Asterophora parasitica TaxID=117018 RepID=A0A9P7G729_9AGAR|nr:hypothetical protein DXG03_006491 [Asterophora parasitica]
MFKLSLSLLSVAALLPLVASHTAFFHPSMYGFNVTIDTDPSLPFDNRPVAPLRDRNFSQWWFHGHLDFPPNPTDIFELPVGKPAIAELACRKNATSYFASAEGTTDTRDPLNPNDVCPGFNSTAYHALNQEDAAGCALAITYKSNVTDVQPEDFTVFSVNQTCVWTRFTEFQVPKRMPVCPPGGCTCAFFWTHSNGGGPNAENYMNGFKCNVTGSSPQAPALATPKVPRRCGADPENFKLQNVPGNCTYGAKQPFYWKNLERNNMFEAKETPPVYNDLYNFLDGAQDDIFEDSYNGTLPDPSPVAPVPVLAEVPELPPVAQRQSSTPGSGSGTAGSTCHLKRSFSSGSLATRSLNAYSTGNWVPAMSRRSRKLHTGRAKSLWHIL